VVQESGDTSLVAALDPVDALEPADPTSLQATEEARSALTRVLEKLVEAGPR
jgi:hypothetical protein